MSLGAIIPFREKAKKKPRKVRRSANPCGKPNAHHKKHAAKKHPAKPHAAKKHPAKPHAAKKHSARKHAAQKPATKKHAARKPATGKPATSKPAVKHATATHHKTHKGNARVTSITRCRTKNGEQVVITLSIPA